MENKKLTIETLLGLTVIESLVSDGYNVKLEKDKIWIILKDQEGEDFEYDLLAGCLNKHLDDNLLKFINKKIEYIKHQTLFSK